MTAKATAKTTGEIFEFDVSTPAKAREAWELASDYIKAYEAIKDQIKPIISDIIDDKGIYDFGDAIFRVVSVQRMNYDKSLLRQVLDADTYDLFLKPDKPRIDNYLKENLADLGSNSSLLRKGMIPEGRPYQQFRLEKVK